MSYIRLSIVHPHRGEHDRVERIMRQLVEAAAAIEGCESSLLLKPHDESGDIARIAIYGEEAAADRAANSQHFLALRSELHLHIDANHTERGFSSM